MGGESLDHAARVPRFVLLLVKTCRFCIFRTIELGLACQLCAIDTIITPALNLGHKAMTFCLSHVRLTFCRQNFEPGLRPSAQAGVAPASCFSRLRVILYDGFVV
jgi:hypothetical protein